MLHLNGRLACLADGNKYSFPKEPCFIFRSNRGSPNPQKAMFASTDGVNWNILPTFGNGNYAGAAFIFNNGRMTLVLTNHVFYSPNLNVTWFDNAYALTVGAAFNNDGNIVWIGDTVVLPTQIMFRGDVSLTGAVGIARSNDRSKTWTDIGPGTGFSFGTYDQNKLVTWGATSSTPIKTSIDSGTSWQNVGAPFGAARVGWMAYSPSLNLWVASRYGAATSGNASFAYSSNLTTWTGFEIPGITITGSQVYKVFWSKNMSRWFVKISSGASYSLYHSADLVNWETITIPAPPSGTQSNQINRIAEIPGLTLFLNTNNGIDAMLFRSITDYGPVVIPAGGVYLINGFPGTNSPDFTG